MYLHVPDVGKATMVEVLTMGNNWHYYGINDVVRDKVLKQATVFACCFVTTYGKPKWVT